MDATAQATAGITELSGRDVRGGGLRLEIQLDPAEGERFRAMLEQHMQKEALNIKPNSASLSSVIASRTTNLASQVKQDQLHVSKLLEQATRTGDSMQLMKAMMALNDYQLRVQTISKMVSKAASSVDSLTKLQ